MTLVGVLASFVGLHAYAKARDIVPGVSDTMGRWAVLRHDARDATPADSIFLGSSRGHTGYDPDTMRETLGPKANVYNLSINATSPLPVLEDFAAEESFAGHIVMEFNPSLVFSTTSESKAKQWIAYYRDWMPTQRLDDELRHILGSRVLFMAHQMNLNWLARSWYVRTPLAHIVTMRPTRHLVRRKEFLVRREKTREQLRFRDREPELVTRDLERLRVAVEAIEARGGKVTFVRLPTSGVRREVEEEEMPRATHYERARTHVGGQWFHFEDDPVLADVFAADGHHFDPENAAKLSKRLVELTLK